MVSPLGRTLHRGSEVRRHAHLLEHDVERGVAVESLDLAIPQVEEVRARNVDLCSCWLDHAGGRFHRAAKGSLNGQLNGDDVAHDIDPVKFAVNVGNICPKAITTSFRCSPRYDSSPVTLLNTPSSVKLPIHPGISRTFPSAVW